MIKESGAGISGGGGIDDTPGFGFKVHTYKTGMAPRQESIEEQSSLFGKKYEYKFDFKTIRTNIEKIVRSAGYQFKYQITSKGL